MCFVDVSNVGWTSENTFIHKYLKPLRQLGRHRQDDVHAKLTEKQVVPDKHGISAIWQLQPTRSHPQAELFGEKAKVF